MTSDSQLPEMTFTENFDPFRFFAGKSYAYGSFISRNGEVKRRFTADIIGTQDNGSITLQEHFIFDDGEREDRVWVLHKIDDKNLRAECDDVVGTATGQMIGPTLKLQYDFLLNVSGRKIKFKFDDIIICQDGTHAVNRARVSKFGIFVGEVIISFEKQPH